MTRVQSFDVFDTCLTRRTAVPSGVFYKTAQKVFARLGIPSSVSLVEDFIAARVEAERLVRSQTSQEDVKLEEVWRDLIRAMGWNDATLADCELEAEAELIVPIAAIRKQVQAARQQGCRIVFVSDMYLPTKFIEGQLRKHGFAEPGDGVYVSGDIGKTKASGNLFKHLLAQEKVAASEILHTGDNQRSDYNIPRKLGIRAELFVKGQLTGAELRLLLTGGEPHAAAGIAGAMRAFRLEREAGDENVNALAAQFVAPFVMGFAAWVLQRAQENGVKRLYFLSRDCQLIWKVARELAPQFGGIDCRYLYVSRQALYLPSATAISPEGMPWMRRPFEEPVLKNLLAKIELKFEDVQPSLSELAGNQGELYSLKSKNDWQQFWDALNKDPVKDYINRLIASRREAAKRYFESAGLFDAESWSIVDLGWYLTGQQSLWKLLGTWGCQRRINGYYLALKRGRIGYALAGDSEALVYEKPPQVPRELASSNIFSYQTLLEHIVGCADHPTVHHYEMAGEVKAKPVFASAISQASLNLCQDLHEGVLDFVAKNQALVEDFKAAGFCREVLASLTTSFFKFPTEHSARALGGLSIAVDQNGLDAQPVVKSLTMGTALLPLLPNRPPFAKFRKSRSCVWFEGSIAITPSGIRILSALAQYSANLRGRVRRSFFKR